MNEASARDLQIKSRVLWDNDPSQAGTVVEKTYNRCKVKWDDPKDGEYSILWFSEMGNIGLTNAKIVVDRSDMTPLTEIRI